MTVVAHGAKLISDRHAVLSVTEICESVLSVQVIVGKKKVNKRVFLSLNFAYLFKPFHSINCRIIFHQSDNKRYVSLNGFLSDRH